MCMIFFVSVGVMFLPILPIAGSKIICKSVLCHLRLFPLARRTALLCPDITAWQDSSMNKWWLGRGAIWSIRIYHLCYTAKPSVDLKSGLLNSKAFALSHRLIKAESPNLQLNYRFWFNAPSLLLSRVDHFLEYYEPLGLCMEAPYKKGMITKPPSKVSQNKCLSKAWN